MTATIAVVLGCLAVAIAFVLRERPSPVLLAVCVLALGTLTLLQLSHSFPTLAPRVSRHRQWTFGGQAVLTYSLYGLIDQAWVGIPGLLAASALLTLPAPHSWIVYGLIVASIDAIQFTLGLGLSQLAFSSLATALTGLVCYALGRLSELLSEVQRKPDELARTAVAAERLRFAQDLHDQLGYSLSIITLKSELLLRLIPQQGRAQAELREVLQVAREAQSDIRTVSRNYRELSLRSEAALAQSMLTSAGIRTTARLEYGLLPTAVDTVLATVLREAITNMLWHSDATTCHIEAVMTDSQLRLCVVNDGLTRSATTTGRRAAPSGIGNLSARLEGIGGRLTTCTHEDDLFRLVARVPLPDPDRAAPQECWTVQ